MTKLEKSVNTWGIVPKVNFYFLPEQKTGEPTAGPSGAGGPSGTSCAGRRSAPGPEWVPLPLPNPTVAHMTVEEAKGLDQLELQTTKEVKEVHVLGTECYN